MRRALRETLLMILLAVPLVAVAHPVRAIEPAEAELLRAQDEKFTAIVDVDLAVLQRVLADDLVYVHSTGQVESKAELIAGLSGGSIDYKSLRRTDGVVRIFGDTVVITGTVALEVVAAGQRHAAELRFTDVYVRRDGNWRSVSWQSTRVP